MKLEQKIAPVLQQKLILTPQLRQSLHILQLPLLELRTLIETELVENPLLEEEQLANEEPSLENRTSVPEEKESSFSEDGWEERLSTFSHSIQIEQEEKRNFAESSLQQIESLQDHLLWQLRLSATTPEEEKIGEAIIGNIDENGYLKTTMADLSASLGVDEEKIKIVVGLIQDFDPTGIGARDLRECLLIQLKSLGRETSLAARLIKDYLPEIEKKKWQDLAYHLHLPLDKIKDEIHFISTLEPKPGRRFSSFSPQAIIPDVAVRKTGDSYQAFLNTENTPRLRLNPQYKNILQQSNDAPAREFVEKKLQAAHWLIKSIHQRQQTIIKIAEAIVEYQREFIEKGIEHLKPCTLDQIAEKTGFHKSTVSRAIRQKYMDTPRGTFEFKAFFSKGFNNKDEKSDQLESSPKNMASKTIKAKIETLVENEDPLHPLSDEEITEKLFQEGITISRRTVTKYREELRILSSHLRKK